MTPTTDQLANSNVPTSKHENPSHHCYCLQMKLRKGNVFGSMCQEFCPRRGMCEGMHGRGCMAGVGACVAGRHVWQMGVCGRGHVWQSGMHGRGMWHEVSMVGGMHGRGCVAGGNAWHGGMCGRRACVAGGHCMVGGMHGRTGSVCGWGACMGGGACVAGVCVVGGCVCGRRGACVAGGAW